MNEDATVSPEETVQDGPPRAVTLPVLLIGPVNAGKSTLAPLLAARLGVDSISLDDLCWEYFDQAGHDLSLAGEAFKRGDMDGARRHMVPFYPGAVARIVAEHPHSVIELGAGHSVYDDPALLAQVKRTLAPLPNVVLLLPTPDPGRSLEILNARQSNPYPEVLALNQHFVRHPSNRELATLVVYTEGCTPDQTCDDLLPRLR